ANETIRAGKRSARLVWPRPECARSLSPGWQPDWSRTAFAPTQPLSFRAKRSRVEEPRDVTFQAPPRDVSTPLDMTELLHRISGDDLDALDVHPLFRPIAGESFRRRDFFQDVVALDQFAEGGVLAVEGFRRAVADKKL